MELRKELGDPAFSLHMLEPLGEVSEAELFEFLKDPANGCPAGMASEMSEPLYRGTQGSFEALVALMEEARASSWYSLRDKLWARQGAKPTDLDDIIF